MMMAFFTQFRLLLRLKLLLRRRQPVRSTSFKYTTIITMIGELKLNLIVIPTSTDDSGSRTVLAGNRFSDRSRHSNQLSAKLQKHM
jgi:hypothetical protein